MLPAMSSVISRYDENAFLHYVSILDGLQDDPQGGVDLCEGALLFRRTPAMLVTRIIRVGEMNETQIRFVRPDVPGGVFSHYPSTDGNGPFHFVRAGNRF